MYKLVFIIILGIVTFLGYQQYDSLQQQAQKELQSKNYELEKQALEKARVSKSPQPLNDFIQKYPDSAWRDTAIYYRDKYAVQQLIKSRDTQKLQDFIDNNQNSEWVSSARQHIIKIQREQENREIQQRILNRQPEVEISQSKVPTLTEVNKPASPQPKKVAPTKTDRRSRINDSNERVKRALSIYQKMNKPKIRQEADRKKRQQDDARQLQRCNLLKDQLRQFNRRTRWYKLDDSGKRVFMSKQAVVKRKKEIQNTIKENCS